MDLALAWLAFPALLLALCCGCGLLVAALSRARLPTALAPACGLALIVCVGQFLTLTDATAELAAPVVVALAIAGVALAAANRGRALARPARPDLLFAAGAAVAVFAVFAAPIVLSGEATFAGFIRLDDSATWLALTDRIMEHGRGLADLEPSSYEATLAFNLGDGYPIGAFVPLGIGSTLLGTDPAWLIQPYMAVLAAILALGLWTLAGRVTSSRVERAAAAFLGSQSALLFGYYLWGGVKEIAAAMLIASAAAVAGSLLERRAGIARLAPLALISGALVGVLSAGGLLWLAPILIGTCVLLILRAGAALAIRDAAIFAVGLALLSLPVIIPGGLLPPTSSPLTDDRALGNLIGALEPAQVAGVWPSGDFRLDPAHETATYLLIAAAVALAACGAIRAREAGACGPLLYLGGALLGCAALLLIGSPWVAAKALATASPAIPFAAVLGAGWLAARGLRPLAWTALTAVAAGVLWSNALAYRDVSLAPREQLEELEEIGELVAGEGPTLMTEYSPYGVRHFLRDSAPEGISELRRHRIPLRDGRIVRKGLAADTDRIDPAALGFYRTLVLRRSPAQSRPPAAYRLVWRGDFYQAWQRPSGPVSLPERLALGDRHDPYAKPDCERVAELAVSGDLTAAAGASPLVVPLSAATYPRGWSTPTTRSDPQPRGPGSIEATVRVGRRDEYEIWLGGSLRPRVELFVDEAQAGEVRHQLNNLGGYVRLGAATLAPGRHRIEIRIGAADLGPGSGGAAPVIGPLALTGTEAADTRLTGVGAKNYERLCGRAWDWIEVDG